MELLIWRTCTSFWKVFQFWYLVAVIREDKHFRPLFHPAMRGSLSQKDIFLGAYEHAKWCACNSVTRFKGDDGSKKKIQLAA